MKKAGFFLCGMVGALLMTGCGATMPDLTEEETNVISEYAVGVLLKYDKNYGSRLRDTSEYSEEQSVEPEEPPVEQMPEQEEQEEQEPPVENSTEVVDVSEEENVPSSIEEYYGMYDFNFQYTGYELTTTYPEASDEENIFFAMDATEGTQLLVLKFTVTNESSSDQTLDMLGYGVRFRISVNGEASKGALATMLLNDMQTYKALVPAGSSVELVSIIEVPTGTNVDTIEMVLRGNESDAVLKLQ